MRRFAARIFFLILTIIFCFETHASLGIRIIRPYSEGLLAEAMPWQILSYEDWLFVASEDGLIQYDGLFADLFQVNNRRPLRSISFGKERDKIFVGGINEFGFFEPSPHTSINYVCLSDSIGQDRYLGNIWGIYNDNDLLYVQGDNTVVVYNLSSGNHSAIHTSDKLDVSAFIDGILWLGTDKGLKLLFGNNIVDAYGASALKGKRIRKILPYDNGLLIVTSDGLWKYRDQKLEQLTKYGKEIEKLGEIFTAEIRGTKLALGSVSRGVGILDLASGELDIYNDHNGLKANTIVSLRFDEEGNLIVGVQYGLYKLLLNRPVQRIDNSVYPIGSGNSLLVKDNKLFIGTNRGLSSVDFYKDKNELGQNIRSIPELRGQVWGLTDINGTLFCSHDHGLFIVQKNGTVKKIDPLTGVWNVSKMLNRDDKAYVGTYSGLHLIRLTPDGWIYEAPLENYNSSTFNFVQEKADVIWNDVSELGIDRLVIDTVNNRVKEVKNYKATADGTPLTADIFLSRIDNKIYFSTPKGLYIYDDSTDSFIREEEIYKLLGEPGEVKRLKKVNGGIFALTENELIEADPAGILDRKSLALPPSVIRPMNEGETFFPVGTDFMGMPVKNGFLLFDMTSESDSLWLNVFPHVHISNVVLTQFGDSSVFKGNYGGLKLEPVLTHRENSLRIEFGSPDDLKHGVVYSTRVNNEPWTASSAVLTRDLSNLREGKYTFEVKAISHSGQVSTDSISFRIRPPWWRTKWMLTLYAVLILSLVFFIIRMEQTRVSRKHSKALSAKDKEIALQRKIYQEKEEDKDRQIMLLEKERLDNELKQKARDLAHNMMSLAHKNETLLIVKRDLQNILLMVSKSNTEARKAIGELQEKVVVDIKSDDVLKRVEEEFDIVHDNFMKRLKAEYPAITNNELMLCAYIKMNLSTKEIGPLLNISSRGVETMRYRLRKKLGLEREDSLTNFISNF